MDDEPTIEQFILSIVTGEYYKMVPETDGKYTYPVDDLCNFYYALRTSHERIEFQRVIIDLLSHNSLGIVEYAIQTCDCLNLQAAIPKLLELLKVTLEAILSHFPKGF
ncbi:MAG TPA: hypothetical protein VLL52_06640 [Anaerolineae bacterium]|nr:hypothetical protein [Anaerolineae bacterium]